MFGDDRRPDSGRNNAFPVLPGYVLVRRLALGGSGEVFLAHRDSEEAGLEALKILRPAGSPGNLADGSNGSARSSSGLTIRILLACLTVAARPEAIPSSRWNMLMVARRAVGCRTRVLRWTTGWRCSCRRRGGGPCASPHGRPSRADDGKPAGHGRRVGEAHRFRRCLAEKGRSIRPEHPACCPCAGPGVA